MGRDTEPIESGDLAMGEVGVIQTSCPQGQFIGRRDREAEVVDQRAR